MKTFFKNLLYKGFCSNYWIWFHILAGALGAKIGIWIHLQKPLILGFIIIAAVGWEFIELKVDDVNKIYGSMVNFVWDSAGDILGAVVAAVIVIL